MMMILNEATEPGNFSRIFNTRKLNHFCVDLALEIEIFVKNVSNTARHTCSKVASRGTKNDYTSSSHVFAAVVANTFNDSSSTGIANSKTLSSDTSEEA